MLGLHFLPTEERDSKKCLTKDVYLGILSSCWYFKLGLTAREFQYIVAIMLLGQPRTVSLYCLSVALSSMVCDEFSVLQQWNLLLKIQGSGMLLSLHTKLSVCESSSLKHLMSLLTVVAFGHVHHIWYNYIKFSDPLIAFEP